MASSFLVRFEPSDPPRPSGRSRCRHRDRAGQPGVRILSFAVALVLLSAALPAAGQSRFRRVEEWRSRAQQRVDGFHRRRLAVSEFRDYLRKNPAVHDIWREERRRETVHVVNRNIVLSLMAASAALAIAAITRNPAALPGGAIGLLQAETQVRNKASKVMKARGNTLVRAQLLRAVDSSIDPPPFLRWLEMGLVREGDVRSRQADDGDAR